MVDAQHGHMLLLNTRMGLGKHSTITFYLSLLGLLDCISEANTIRRASVIPRRINRPSNAFL